ncbi:MAG: iron export ABC transporter permease subunit FetB [Actinomycetota bacterium]|nr:iron export ABC transporter permease subunit FetB [Actinomycetota bacterium]
MPGDVTPVGLALSLVLVAVAVVLSRWQRLGLQRRMVWASARAIAQLLLVGAALGLVIDPRAPLAWSWLWIAGMTLFAGDVVRRRIRELPGVLPLAVAAFAASAAVTLGTLFGLGIFPMEPRTVVPLGGMMIGNSMNATVVAARRILEELRDKRSEVEVRLALGQPSREAARPYLAAALRTALIPQIETTRAVGLVFLPGAMTGLILAGVEPMDAVLVQAVVMFLVLGAAATTTSVIGLGLTRRFFTHDHRLVTMARPAQL